MHHFSLRNILLIITGIIALSACNTFEGLGKDISRLGQKIENKADR